MEHVAIAEARALQHRADILQRLLRLRFDADGQLAVGPDADLAREIEDVADTHGIGKGERLAVEGGPSEMLDGGARRGGVCGTGHGENSGCECECKFH